jgi:hypothetical protein
VYTLENVSGANFNEFIFIIRKYKKKFYKRGDYCFTFGASFRNGETAGLLLVENNLLNVRLFYLRKKRKWHLITGKDTCFVL